MFSPGSGEPAFMVIPSVGNTCMFIQLSVIPMYFLCSHACLSTGNLIAQLIALILQPLAYLAQLLVVS